MALRAARVVKYQLVREEEPLFFSSTNEQQQQVEDICNIMRLMMHEVFGATTDNSVQCNRWWCVPG